MRSRRSFLRTLLASGLVACTPGLAQQTKVVRLGYLIPGPQNPYERVLLDALRDAGYVEGQNLLVERRLGTPGELPAMAEDLVRKRVDAIYAGASSGVRAAANATKEIPIIAADLETDPVASGYVTSLARPGGNLTGFFLDLPEFTAKRLEVLKDALPHVTTVMVLWDSSLDRAPLKRLDSAAQALGPRPVLVETQGGNDLDTAFNSALNRKAQAVLVMQSPSLDARKDRILELASKHRLPVVAMFANFAAAGAILSYGPDVRDMVSRSAEYVDRVLKGANPGELPIQRPVKFDLVVNQRTAIGLGIVIGQPLLVRADEVIR